MNGNIGVQKVDIKLKPKKFKDWMLILFLFDKLVL